jgi:hypothetical protein
MRGFIGSASKRIAAPSQEAGAISRTLTAIILATPLDTTAFSQQQLSIEENTILFCGLTIGHPKVDEKIERNCSLGLPVAQVIGKRPRSGALGRSPNEFQLLI